MDQKLLSDMIASTRKALEGFVTPSVQQVRTEAHMDSDQLRIEIEALRKSVAQLHADVGQTRQKTISNSIQVREEARQFRAQINANFVHVREEFKQVRNEAQQFRAETTIQFVQVREEVTELHTKVDSLCSAMEREFADVGAKLDMQADIQRLKEQIASIQASQQVRALEAH